MVAYDIRGWRCACERPSPTISKVRSRLTVSVAGVPSTGRAHQGSSGQGRAARAKSWPLPGPNRQRLLGEAKCPRLLSPHSRLRPACFSLCRSRRVCVCVCVWRHHRLTLPLLVCEGCKELPASLVSREASHGHQDRNFHHPGSRTRRWTHQDRQDQDHLHSGAQVARGPHPGEAVAGGHERCQVQLLPWLLRVPAIHSGQSAQGYAQHAVDVCRAFRYQGTPSSSSPSPCHCSLASSPPCLGFRDLGECVNPALCFAERKYA